MLVEAIAYKGYTSYAEHLKVGWVSTFFSTEPETPRLFSFTQNHLMQFRQSDNHAWEALKPHYLKCVAADFRGKFWVMAFSIPSSTELSVDQRTVLFFWRVTSENCYSQWPWNIFAPDFCSFSCLTWKMRMAEVDSQCTPVTWVTVLQLPDRKLWMNSQWCYADDLKFIVFWFWDINFDKVKPLSDQSGLTLASEVTPWLKHIGILPLTALYWPVLHTKSRYRNVTL